MKGGGGRIKLFPAPEKKTDFKKPGLIMVNSKSIFFKCKRQLFEMMLCDII